jgi:hypothetical protein
MSNDPWWRVRIVVDGALLHFASRTEPRAELTSGRPRDQRLAWLHADWIRDGVDADVLGFIDYGKVTAVSWRRVKPRRTPAELEREREERLSRTWDAIEAYVLEHGGCSWREVEESVAGQATYLRRRRDAMLADGVLVDRGSGHHRELWHRDHPEPTA